MRSAVGARAYARLKRVHETAKRKGQEFLRVVTYALTRIIPGQLSRSASTG